MTHETTKKTVAEFITAAISTSGKTQREIAQEIGYDNPNIISMFKQGLTKVPLNKVGSLAKALEVDPVFLLRMTLNEYAPDTLRAIEDVLETSVLTKNERDLIEAYRKATHGTDATAVIADGRDVIALVMV